MRHVCVDSRLAQLLDHCLMLQAALRGDIFAPGAGVAFHRAFGGPVDLSRLDLQDRQMTCRRDDHDIPFAELQEAVDVVLPRDAVEDLPVFRQVVHEGFDDVELALLSGQQARHLVERPCGRMPLRHA